MADMIVLGIDPGSTSHGWAVLDLERGRRGRWVAGRSDKAVQIARRGMHGPWSWMSEAEVVDHAAPAGSFGLIAVETPAGYVHEHKRGAALLDTAVEAGRLLERAGSIGVRLTAAEVRKALKIGEAGNDAAVKAALGVFLDMPKTSNVHARDAAACALVGWWRMGSKP